MKTWSKAQSRLEKLNKIKGEHYKSLTEARSQAIKEINAAKAEESIFKVQYRDLMCKLAESKRIVSEKQAKYSEVLSKLTEFKKLTPEDFATELEIEED